MGNRVNGTAREAAIQSTLDSSRDDLFRQQTIRRPAAISGVGIHSGRTSNLRVLPAPSGSGVRFRRIDAGNVEIRAHIDNISSLDLATTLGRDDVTVSTVEHLLAAVHVLGLDNLTIELDGPEVPILDGSATPYLRLLQAAGIRRQDAMRRILAIRSELEIERGEKRLRVSPHSGLRLDYTIDFQDCAVGRQRLELDIDARSFERELAPARTFCREQDVELMRRYGLGLGGSVDNCIVFDSDGAMNTELRFADEPVRHKALDAVGDISLLGAPIWGSFEIVRGGHQLHYELLAELVSRPDCLTWLSDEAEPADVDLSVHDRTTPAWTPALARQAE